MTEILDSNDGHGDLAGDWTSEVPPDPEAPDDELFDFEPDEPDVPGRWSSALHSITDPASLAVAAVLALLCAAVSGPAYVFEAYPFNQGVDSFSTVFDLRGSAIRPLHDFLMNAAPTIALASLALVCAVVSLLRLGPSAPAWVRAGAAGALVVALALGALVAVGGYRVSGLDLTVPTTPSTSSG